MYKNNRYLSFIVFLIFLFSSVNVTFAASEPKPSKDSYISSTISEDGIVYYVSTEGNDGWDGSLPEPNSDKNNGPFATIQRARDVIRERISGGMTSDIVVMIRAGKYYQDSSIVFDERDSGRNGYKIVYKNYPEEQPEIIGGQAVKDWTLDSGNIYKAFVGTGWKFNTLYENGERAVKARTPNNDYLLVDKAGPSKTAQFSFKKGDLPQNFNYKNAQVYAWPGGANYNWFSELRQITSIDWNKNIITLEGTGWTLADGIRYFVQGSKDLLDQAGEFYLDEATGYLYYWPRHAPIENQEIVAPKTMHIIEVKGSSPSSIASNICFEGLTFTESDALKTYLRPDNYGELDSNRHGMLYFENAADNSVRYCNIKNSGTSGIILNKYAQSNVIYGNRIENFGYNGVYLVGWRAADKVFSSPEAADVNKFNTVSNNLVVNGGELVGHGSGIQLNMSGNNEISYNEVRGMSRYGISMKGNALPIQWQTTRNNIVKYNDVSDVLRDSQDGGAIEQWSGGPNNIIDNNCVHDSNSLFGIYNDDKADDAVIKNNIIYNLGTDRRWGIGESIPLCIKGNNVVATNNIIANNVGTRSIFIGVGAGSTSSNMVITKNIVAPLLTNIYAFSPWVNNKIKEADNNVFYSPNGKYHIGGIANVNTFDEWKQLLNNKYDQNSVLADPLFENAENGDFRLKEDSPALKLGIAQIDQLNIGLKNDFPRRVGDKIEAEKYNNMNNVINNQVNITNGKGGSWAEYANIDFGNQPVTLFEAKIAAGKESSGGKIELRLDDPNGTLVGTMKVKDTGGYDRYQTQATTINNVTGKHSLYLVFINKANVCNLDWFKLYSNARNAYDKVKARTYDGMNGVKIVPETVQDKTYGDTDISVEVSNGGWLEYDNVYLGKNNISKFEMDIAADGSSAGGDLEIHLDSLTGPAAGVLKVQDTGSIDSSTLQSTLVMNATGVHNVFLVFNKDGIQENGCVINWFKLTDDTFRDPKNNIRAIDYDCMKGITINNNIISDLQNGDWVKYDNLYFGNGDPLQINAELAVDTANAGGNIELRLDSPSGNLIGTMTVKDTGGFDIYYTYGSGVIKDVSGIHDLYFVFKRDTGAQESICNMRGFSFSAPAIRDSEGDHKILASSYNDMVGILNAGQYVGYCDAGHWVRYDNVVFPENTGTFEVSVAVPDAYAKGKIQLRIGSLTGTIIGEAEVQASGSFTTFSVQQSAISNISGTHDLFLIFSKDGTGNIEWFKFYSGTPVPPPTPLKLEAENYSNMAGINNYGTYIGGCSNGEWISFNDVNLGDGYTRLTTKVAVDPAYAGQQMEVRLDSPTGTLVGTLTVQNTGGWGAFKEQTTLLTGANGKHNIYFVFKGGSGIGNFDYFIFK